MIKFSIIICVFNAVPRLQKTLEHLASIEYPSDFMEVIIVDNNSSDGSAEFAEKIWNSCNPSVSLKIVRETQQGLSSARKRGIFESRFDYLVFCDDDNWLDSQYLMIANDTLSNNKSIGVLGGQGLPVTDADGFPNWFYTYSGGYAVGVQAMKSGDISGRGFVWGAGAVMRRDLLVAIFSAGYELLLSGRIGEKLAAGDDCEMCKWFLLANYRLWYEENMIFRHFISRERLTTDYLNNLFIGFSDSSLVLARYDHYLRRRASRTLWYKKPVCWLKSELEVFLDISYQKRRVAELAGNVVSLGL